MLSFNKNCSLHLSSANHCCTCRADEVDAQRFGVVLVVDKYFCNQGNIEELAFDFNQCLIILVATSLVMIVGGCC